MILLSSSTAPIHLPLSFKSALFGGLVTLALSGAASAANYVNDFSGTGGNTAFPNESIDADWSVTGGVYRFSTNTTTTTASTASVSLPDVAGTGFVMESTLAISSFGSPNSNGITLGFGVLGSSTGFGGTSTSPYYLADWQVGNTGAPGTLRIVALGDTAGFNGASQVVDVNAAATLAALPDTSYTLRLTGTYVSGTLNMTLGVFDASGVQIGASATASDTSPLAGEYFGYRNRTGLGGGTLTADFTNFSVVSVPEPASAALLGLGVSMGAFVRRRSMRA